MLLPVSVHVNVDVDVAWRGDHTWCGSKRYMQETDCCQVWTAALDPWAKDKGPRVARMARYGGYSNGLLACEC